MGTNESNTEIVIDLETTDTVGSKKKMAAMLSIGAIAFNPKILLSMDEMMPESKAIELSGKKGAFVYEDMFYSPVSLHASLAEGFTYSKETIKWWAEKELNMISIAAEHKIELPETFGMFMRWIKQVKPKKVWANAPVFDIAILREAFDHLDMKFDVDFRSERDVRTARDFADISAETKRSPEYFPKHHALFDCVWEANVIQTMYAKRRMYEGLAVENLSLKEKILQLEEHIKGLSSFKDLPSSNTGG